MSIAARDRSDEVFVAERPWGQFQQFVSNESCTVKIITVEPGHRLWLQTHGQRDEMWQVLDVPIDIQVDDRSWTAQPGERVWVPQGARHRMGNSGEPPPGACSRSPSATSTRATSSGSRTTTPGSRRAETGSRGPGDTCRPALVLSRPRRCSARGDGRPVHGELPEPPAARAVQDRPAVAAQGRRRGEEPLARAVRRVWRLTCPRGVQRGEEAVHPLAGDVAVDQRLGQPLGDLGRALQTGQAQRQGQLSGGRRPSPPPTCCAGRARRRCRRPAGPRGPAGRRPPARPARPHPRRTDAAR